MKKTALSLSALLIITTLLSACSITLSTEPPATATSASQAKPTVLPTEAAPAPTDTPAATVTAAPTPEPVFKAGIPAKIEDCNRMTIFAPSTEIDAALIESQMTKLVAAEKGYIQVKGITAKDVNELKTFPGSSEPGKLPYDYVIAEAVLYPISCTLVDAGDGTTRLMVGLVFKQNIQATTVAVGHFLLDDPGLEKYMFTEGRGTDYTSTYSPQATFNQLTIGPRWYVSLHLWVPSSNPDQQLFPEWRVSQELMTLNQDAPVALNMYLSGTKLDPAVEGSYVPRLEKMIFPTMWLWVTAVK